MTAARANVVTNQPRRSSLPSPSSSEVEAKSRFVLALNKGVDLLLDLGHGRERASTELLTAIGSSPDESEVSKQVGHRFENSRRLADRERRCRLGLAAQLAVCVFLLVCNVFLFMSQNKHA